MFLEFKNPAGLTTQEIFWTNRYRRPVALTANPYCAVSLQVWDKWKLRLTGKVSPLMPLTTVPECPDDLGKWLSERKEISIATLKDITHKGDLLTKTYLENKLNRHLPWMYYFQLCSVVSKPAIRENLKRQTTSFERLLLEKDDSMRHKLSLIYRILLSSQASPMESHKRKWETDCGITLDANHWDMIYQKTVLSNKISPLHHQAIKILNHWYITPSWLYKIKRLSSPQCWKGCGQRADAIHCWWLCPRIRPF